MTIQVGDVVGFVYAQPGNDTTYMLVESIDGDRANCWDVGFEMPVANVELSKLWKASERELQSSIRFNHARR